MTRILLIRHGQSANNASAEQDRVCDPDLTAIGRQQAELTAQRLQASEINKLYCSPFLRALETALPIARNKQMPVHVRADIFEQGGCYSGHAAIGRRGEPGMGRTELSTRYPGWILDEAICDSGWWGRDYETWEAAQARAEDFVRTANRELVPHGGVHAFVIHADFKALLLAAFAQNDFFDIGRPLRNTGVSILQHCDQQWQLVELNSTSHLPADLTTA